jgi:hypothetical protein
LQPALTSLASGHVPPRTSSQLNDLHTSWSYDYAELKTTMAKFGAGSGVARTTTTALRQSKSLVSTAKLIRVAA